MALGVFLWSEGRREADAIAIDWLAARPTLRRLDVVDETLAHSAPVEIQREEEV